MFGYEYRDPSPMKCKEPDLEEMLKYVRVDKEKLKRVDDALVTIAEANLPMPVHDDVSKLMLMMFGAVRVRKDELDRRESEILSSLDKGTPA